MLRLEFRHRLWPGWWVCYDFSWPFWPHLRYSFPYSLCSSHTRKPGIMSSPTSFWICQTAFVVSRPSNALTGLQRPAFNLAFPVSHVCSKGPFTSPVVSSEASVGLMVLSPVSIPQGKVLEQVGLSQQPWAHIPFPPVVPMLAQIPVVTGWYLDEMWEDFSLHLSLT